MNRYERSTEQYHRAIKTIPLGSQTFSKSAMQYPLGSSPLFAERAKGATIWDVDGNAYTDFVNALAAVTLGYGDPDVDRAAIEQIQRGTVFSLNSRIESEVAETIVELVPSAQKVRFGKNGSDATAAAVRLARAHTGRDHILVAGYHGWQDWYIGSTSRDKGVPAAVKGLTHKFAFNDTVDLERCLDTHDGNVAAVVMEPMNVQFPKEGYLEFVRDITRRKGIVLIFDETITGFRFDLGGAQKLLGVTPDLTTLGKGIANGYPLSAICGNDEVMAQMEDIFFSFTMGGEAVSLAAAKAVLDKLKREPVIDTMCARGQSLLKGLGTLIEKHAAAEVATLSGHPTWTFFQISASGGYSVEEIKSLWMQMMFERGMLTIGTHNISYAHSQDDIDRLLSVYDEVLPLLVAAIRDRRVAQLLRGPVLKPVFKVR
jgi:glutamate-1-semialdehyde 2,1-aminomutase